MKKKIQNGKRSSKEVTPEQSSESTEAKTNEEMVDETTIKHLQMTVSMIEGRKVSRAEILALISRMRQHRMAKEKKLPYPAHELDDKPG